MAQIKGAKIMKQFIYVNPSIVVIKRIIDIIGAVVGIIIVLPIVPFIIIAIKLSSAGPVIFTQKRVGRIKPSKVEVFNILKFRTMCVNAEAKTGPVWATKNDPRLTKVGIFLRRTRLDEIPQFINVLKGDMSLIGPRPERPMITKNLEVDIPYYTERTYGVTPGITGLAQVNQGYDENLEDVRSKLAYDLAYSLALTEPKLWLLMDWAIIVKTIKVMFSGRGQ